MKSPATVLMISQVFVPDTPSVGQHLFDLACELTARQKRVVVLTPRGGYEDPSVRFPRRETIAGVVVRRIPWCTFGKNSIPLRLLGGMSLTVQSMIRGLFIGGLTHVAITTAPPMSGLAAAFIKFIRRVKVVYWVMDINPDQMIATGRLKEASWMAKLSKWIGQLSLRRANTVVTLDRYMASRLMRQANLEAKMAILPPWPYQEQLADIAHESNPFRAAQPFAGRFVVMYSGNISAVHPLDTLWQAIQRLQDDPRFLFVFIGAKAARGRIETIANGMKLRHVITLDYVPLSETKFSLSAADLHLVVMGNDMVGVVHPCKVYGILSVGRPFLAIAPQNSHLGEILQEAPVGWRVDHGDIDGAVRILRRACEMPLTEREAIAVHCRELIQRKFSRNALCTQFAGFFD